MEDERERYSLEEDIKCLQEAGKIVLARTITINGWAILWYDKSGYTVTYTERHGRGVGGARSFDDGMDEYVSTIRRLM